MRFQFTRTLRLPLGMSVVQKYHKVPSKLTPDKVKSMGPEETD